MCSIEIHIKQEGFKKNYEHKSYMFTSTYQYSECVLVIDTMFQNLKYETEEVQNIPALFW